MGNEPTEGLTSTERPISAQRGGVVASRRRLFAGAGAVGAGALLAACSDGDSDGPAGEGDRPAGQLAEVGEVEVGGGMVNAPEGVVVTQPVEGDFRGFSAICTHQGCTVSQVAGGLITCNCHGSQYSIEDGSVVRAAPELTPETQDPLSPVAVTVEDGAIVRS